MLAHMTHKIMSRDRLQTPIPLASDVTVACQIYNTVPLTEVSRQGIAADLFSTKSPVGINVSAWFVKVAGVLLIEHKWRIPKTYKIVRSKTRT